MTVQEHIIHPGDLLSMGAPGQIKTVLGSCVAVTFWNADTHFGGMCHYLLDKPNTEEQQPPSNRYGCFALDTLLQIRMLESTREKLNIGLFGGGNLFPSSSSPTIGERNVSFARQWLSDKGLQIKNEDVLGNVCRTLILNLKTGNIYVKRYSPDFGGVDHEH